jgi:hypothetical protein
MKAESKNAIDLESVDLGSLDTVTASNEGVDIEIFDPTNTSKSLNMFIKMLGKDSDVFRNYIRENVNDKIKREAKLASKGMDIQPPTAEQAEANALELLIICSKGWYRVTGYEDKAKTKPVVSDTWLFKGEELKFSVANVKRVYETLPWLRKQVDVAIGDLENFIPGLPTN